ncbi:nucleotidyltransferase domain-containing protein [Streptomyces murinus]|uniref:nucleotidyltransferase domain-containing protein n=1 Tax=Streptomyces murinus TaxID=33900 RepID=UPI002114EF9E|nr:nucleotidyltransferase domain-containing protein [Streptomyces murinus]
MRRTGAAESPPDQTGVPPERLAEVREFLDRLTRWAATREDIVGLLLVGSYARGAARPDSDVDVVLLTADPAPYLTDAAESDTAESDTAEFDIAESDIAESGGPWTGWAGELGLGRLVRTRVWGPLTERRYTLVPGLEVEFGIGGPRWARTDPVDPGTRRVVAEGARTLYDPRRVLAELVRHCRP